MSEESQTEVHIAQPDDMAPVPGDLDSGCSVAFAVGVGTLALITQRLRRWRRRRRDG